MLNKMIKEGIRVAIVIEAGWYTVGGFLNTYFESVLNALDMNSNWIL